MKPKIAIMSYRWLTSLIRSVEHNYSKHVDIVIIDVLFEDALKVALKMEENQEADVFVSAGANAHLLSKHLKVPFVEIKVTGFDILHAVKKANEFSKKICMLTFKKRIPYLDGVKKLLNCSVFEETYGELNEIDAILGKLLDKGITTVIGSSLVLERVKARGLHGVFIYSTEGIMRALDSAVKIAISKKAESEKAERFRIILDFAYGGIIATDQHGNVTAYNPSAEKIIGIPKKNILGRPIVELIPSTNLMNVINSARPELNQFQTIGDIKILTNRIPIITNGEVTGAVATFQDINSIQIAEETIRKRIFEKGFHAKAKLDDIYGDSKAIRGVKREASLIAKTDSTILILGESGTGKELFAQGIHNQSSRARRPFITVNCAALPENLLESELFGYEEGAFTGARKGGKRGFFELAHGGTIFLDEIGEISPKLQSRLLRVLEEHEVMRIGGDRIIPVNIRVIAASNKRLWELVEKGEFREDLYYRINVLELYLPPLRERQDDPSVLGHTFLSELRKDLRKEDILRIVENPIFKSYGWPGNVRELKNVIERISVLYKKGMDCSALLKSYFRKCYPKNHDKYDYNEIRTVLRSFHGNKTKAAKKLGISRTSLWRLLGSSDFKACSK